MPFERETSEVCSIRKLEHVPLWNTLYYYSELISTNTKTYNENSIYIYKYA